jgi:hypothetical protein
MQISHIFKSVDKKSTCYRQFLFEIFLWFDIHTGFCGIISIRKKWDFICELQQDENKIEFQCRLRITTNGPPSFLFERDLLLSFIRSPKYRNIYIYMQMEMLVLTYILTTQCRTREKENKFVTIWNLFIMLNTNWVKNLHNIARRNYIAAGATVRLVLP